MYNIINKSIGSLLTLTILLSACGPSSKEKKAANAGKEDTLVSSAHQEVNLPSPYATKSALNFSKLIDWPEGKMPVAPEGFTVTQFAKSLNNPRWIYIASNGDIFVSQANTHKTLKTVVRDKIIGKSQSENTESSSNNILLFRDTNNDGVADYQTTFLAGLNQPFGMLILGNSFYVADTDGVLQYSYTAGQTKISTIGKKIISLPAGGYNNHWTRNLLASADGKKIYITVGSGSNVAEHGMENEVRRANILEINPDGTGERVYASGLRNPVGMAWAPGTKTLWTSVNERDALGDDLVPDYLTSVKEGGFYGWPYAYWGQHEDPRMKENQRPDMVKQTIVPDVDLGSHTASLGLAFDEQNSFPGKYKGAAFIGQHGSWNRSTLVGYQVACVVFKNGKASGPAEPFLTGFIADNNVDKVYGRPVGVAFTKQGALLVADDAGNTIWQVMANK